LRYAAICKTLHVLPRLGGVLDQPFDEIIRIEKMLDTFVRYEELERTRERTRAKNREQRS